MILYKELQALKDKSHLSNQEIADRSGVPLATVKRIICGQTQEPSYQAVIAIIRALDGTIEDVEFIAGDERNAPESERIAHKMLINLYERAIEVKNRWIKTLVITCLIVLGLIVTLFIWDILSPSIGFFRRKEQNDGNTSAAVEVVEVYDYGG